MDFVGVIRSINLTDPSWDLLVLAVFAVGIYLFIFRWGKDKAFTLLLSSYISLALVSKLPLLEKVSGIRIGDDFQNKSIFFLLGLGAFYWILNNSDYASIFNRGMKRAWFQILVISFLEIGFVISVLVSFLPPAEARELSIFLKAIFLDNTAQAFWLISPLFATFLIKER
jgi:hypothetical protein